MKTRLRHIFITCLAGMAAVLLTPGAVLALTNPHYDPKAVDGDLVDVCGELWIVATTTSATLHGLCNINEKDRAGSQTLLEGSIRLDEDIDDGCYKWVDLHILESGVEIAVGCSDPDPRKTVTRNGITHTSTVEQQKKLDDTIGWSSTQEGFYRKE